MDLANNFRALDALRAAAGVSHDRLAKAARIPWLRYLEMAVDPIRATARYIEKLKAALFNLFRPPYGAGRKFSQAGGRIFPLPSRNAPRLRQGF